MTGEAVTLLLQLGDNPSVDYYLRPRLQEAQAPWAVADLREDPSRCALMARDRTEPLQVVFCRYASSAWLRAVKQAGPRVARTVLFLDDDIDAMMRDAALPALYRMHLWRHYGLHRRRLKRMSDAVWTSTAVLADRYSASAVLPPLPEADPPPPRTDTAPLVVYHGSFVHRRERAFVLEVAAAVAVRRPEVRFEVVGAKPARGVAPNVHFTPERAWPDFLAHQAGRSAALALAPLFPTAVNAARAPVKRFDAARLGAAGLYVDAPPYRDVVRDKVDGRLLPMSVEAWAEAIVALIDDPPTRIALAEAARRRLKALRRQRTPLPGLA